jgi:hypothetical protein
MGDLAHALMLTPSRALTGAPGLLSPFGIVDQLMQAVNTIAQAIAPTTPIALSAKVADTGPTALPSATLSVVTATLGAEKVATTAARRRPPQPKRSRIPPPSPSPRRNQTRARRREVAPRRTVAPTPPVATRPSPARPVNPRSRAARPQAMGARAARPAHSPPVPAAPAHRVAAHPVAMAVRLVAAARPAPLRSHTLHCRLADRNGRQTWSGPRAWVPGWTDRGARGPGGCGEFASAHRLFTCA